MINVSIKCGNCASAVLVTTEGAGTTTTRRTVWAGCDDGNGIVVLHPGHCSAWRRDSCFESGPSDCGRGSARARRQAALMSTVCKTKTGRHVSGQIGTCSENPTRLFIHARHLEALDVQRRSCLHRKFQVLDFRRL